MIPKIIHYCWFGNNPKSKLMEKCIKSWYEFCPDYEIIEWNESNIDISDCVYAQQAFENKKWSHLSDYIRYKVIYEYGGIYLDTDVELIKSLDPLLSEKAFLGFESTETVASGLGYGAEPHHPIVLELCEAFRNMKLIHDDGSENYEIQPVITTRILLEHGLKQDNTLQHLDNITIYPTEYFAPKNYCALKPDITKNTYSIHWFTSSWQTDEQRAKHKKEVWSDYLIHLPNKVLIKILGEKFYNKIKHKLK